MKRPELVDSIRSAAVVALLVLVSATASADHVLNNGLAPPAPTNVFGLGSLPIDEYLQVRNVGCGLVDPRGDCASPGSPTGAEIVNGADFFVAAARDTSWIRMEGGAVERFGSSDEGTATLVDGAVQRANASDESAFEVLGGVIEDPFIVWRTASLVVSGGLLRGGIDLRGSSTATVSGGTIDVQSWTRDTSRLVVTGGDFTSEIRVGWNSKADIYGGQLVYLSFLWPSSSRIYGIDFALDGVPIPYGLLTSGGGRTLTGTLASGETLDATLYAETSQLTFVEMAPPAAVPVASTWAQLALASLLGMASLLAARAASSRSPIRPSLATTVSPTRLFSRPRSKT